MRSRRKRQPYELLEQMSKGQRELGDILQRLFPNYRIYFEYTYYDILYRAIKHDKVPIKVYTHHYLEVGKRYKSDWVILDLNLVFEYQGRQHYQPVAFGGDDDLAKERFMQQRFIDRKKRQIIAEAGWDLIEVPYFAKLTDENVFKWVEGRKYAE